MTYSLDELIKMRELYVDGDCIKALLEQVIETTKERDGLFGFVQNTYRAHPNIAEDIAALPPAPEMPSASRSE